MNITWFKNPDHLVYINAAKDLQHLESRLRLPGLAESAKKLHDAPFPEGYSIKGRRTMARLFIPDLVFPEHIEMGENIFLYFGGMTECYVLYWLKD